MKTRSPSEIALFGGKFLMVAVYSEGKGKEQYPIGGGGLLKGRDKVRTR